MYGCVKDSGLWTLDSGLWTLDSGLNWLTGLLELAGTRTGWNWLDWLAGTGTGWNWNWLAGTGTAWNWLDWLAKMSGDDVRRG